MEGENADWKSIMKERRKALYQKMKLQRKRYLNQPEVKERMQILKFKAKNRRKAFLKKLREDRYKKRESVVNGKSIL